MAGHSKWANIRYRKGAQDAKRGKIFTKFIREITVSARLGGGDVNSNPRLRQVVDKALGQNMTRDTIDRAISRGVGGQDGADMESIRYEGYGPFGVAVMVDCLTDNRNRTVSEVRHVFSKMGGSLGTDGSVAYLFQKVGQIFINGEVDENKLTEVVLESPADDIEKLEDARFLVTTAADKLMQVKDFLTTHGFSLESADFTMLPSTNVMLDNVEDAQSLMKMLDMLEDLDDVQEVCSNVDIPDEILQKLN